MATLKSSVFLSYFSFEGKIIGIFTKDGNMGAFVKNLLRFIENLLTWLESAGLPVQYKSQSAHPLDPLSPTEIAVAINHVRAAGESPEVSHTNIFAQGNL